MVKKINKPRRRDAASIAEQIALNRPPSGYTEKQLKAMGPVMAKKLLKLQELTDLREMRKRRKIEHTKNRR